ncbi:MAG: formyltransferase family protein [Candidatus Diapherotrites archaeon]
MLEPFSPKPLFDSKKQPLKIAVLFSGNAGSAQFLLQQSKENPSLEKKVLIVGAICDKAGAKGIRFFESHKVRVSVIDWNEFALQFASKKKETMRALFFEKVLHELRKIKPDLLMLSGFMRIIPENLLCEFKNRILNVHPSNLKILVNGRPAFAGKNAVFDTLFAGQTELRSTIHFVTSKVDCGPVLVLSKPLKADIEKITSLRDDKARLQEYADFLQERLKREGDDPAFLKAIELIADGLVLVKNEKVFIKEKGKWKQGYFDLETNSVKKE